jgi:hypothetical protein
MTYYLLIALNVLLLVALLAWIPYSIDHKILTPRKWGIALLASLAWGVGGNIAGFITMEKWGELAQYFLDYESVSYLVDSIDLTGYLSLALVGILAALFGFTALYLLQRYLPQKSPQPPTS